jgi:hypothetical protein
MLAAITAVISLACASVALAAPTKVTGGTTKITASSAVTTLLTANHLTVTPVAPATASGSTFTFPISGGTLNVTTLRGTIRHDGGIQISNGPRTATLRRPTIVSDAAGVSLWAVVRDHTDSVCHRIGRSRFRCRIVSRVVTARIAQVTGVTVSNGTASGTVKITAFTAHVINRLAGKQIAAAGDVLGTATISPTLK